MGSAMRRSIIRAARVSPGKQTVGVHQARRMATMGKLDPEVMRCRHPNVRGETRNMNLVTAVNDALRVALSTDDNACTFGEDVGFGGVFRAAVDLREEFGGDRVFNTPL